MPVHDISLPISESLVIWPGDPEIRVTHPLHLDKGDTVTVSRICLGVHTGTHVDAPAHFIRNGANVDELELNVLIGQALVVDALEADMLSADVLEKTLIPPGVRRILFRTRNSDRWKHGEQEFSRNFIAITEDGARWLTAQNFLLVGIDYLSVAPVEASAPIHRILLENNIVILEGLDLSSIAAGLYRLVCLPLRIVGCEGAPARAVLIDMEDKELIYG